MSDDSRFDFSSILLRQAESAVRGVAARALNELFRMVDDDDCSSETKRAYRNGTSIEDVSADGFTIKVRGVLPNIIERGMGPNGVGSEGPYDMRKFLLRPTTRNIRRYPPGSKHAGKMYLNVPFDHSAADVAAAGGAAASRAVKALPPTVSAPGRGTKWGGSLGPGFGPRRTNKVTREPWTTDKLHGLVRLQKTYARATQATLRTWRRISERGVGNDRLWWSRGTRARHFLRRLQQRIGRLLAEGGRG